MTSLQGYVTCTYAELVAAFGPPSGNHDDSKCDAQWDVEIPALGAADVYNYKNGRNYQGPDAPAVEDITDWNIGGDRAAVVEVVAEAIRSANPGRRVTFRTLR